LASSSFFRHHHESNPSSQPLGWWTRNFCSENKERETVQTVPREGNSFKLSNTPTSSSFMLCRLHAIVKITGAVNLKTQSDSYSEDCELSPLATLTLISQFFSF
jgi:hypothetical protein